VDIRIIAFWDVMWCVGS